MECTKPEIEAAREAVRVLGGPSSAARLLKVPKQRHQTVQSWLRTRVPAEYCPSVEAQTRARGSVVYCERLRPDVAWGLIRGFDGPTSQEAVGGGHVDTVDASVAQANACQNTGEKF